MTGNSKDMYQHPKQTIYIKLKRFIVKLSIPQVNLVCSRCQIFKFLLSNVELKKNKKCRFFYIEKKNDYIHISW